MLGRIALDFKCLFLNEPPERVARMIRVMMFLAAVLVAAVGLSWLSDNPGTVSVYWPALNLKADPTVFQVIIGLTVLVGAALLTWSLIRQIWNSPAAMGSLMNRRRQQRGLDALSSGMIAIGAGDRDTATRYAIQARKSLPNEPLTHLLRAQAAQLSGDKATSRRIFEAMLAAPDTEQLGLRGLFIEAQRENEQEPARQFAERALKLNPKLSWAADSLFEIQCKTGDYSGALETLALARRNSLLEKPLADRRRAVLLTGQALQIEDADPAKALQLAIEAHGLANDLIPAANLAGRMLASKGQTSKAARIIQKTWARSPHPDLATAYAFARIGDSPRDRLERVKQLAALNPHSAESAIAVANAAIDAKNFDEARSALEPLVAEGLTQRTATLLARIESEENGDKGRVREWLARAVNAQRDPVWTADGIVSESWAPVSPVTGHLDAFQWRVPVENVSGHDTELIARRAEELVALGAPKLIDDDAVDAAPAKTDPTTSKESASPRRSATVVDADVVLKPSPSPTPVLVRREEKTASANTSTASATIKPTPPSAYPGNAVMNAKADKLNAVPPSTQPVVGSPRMDATPALKTAAPKKPNDANGKDARIFVVPHAPDDPGPDSSESDASAKGTRPPYRAVP
jgi:HemY protein